MIFFTFYIIKLIFDEYVTMETFRIVALDTDTSTYTFPTTDYGKSVSVESITIPTNPAVFHSTTTVFTVDGVDTNIPAGSYSQGSLVRKLREILTDYTVALNKVTGKLELSKGSSFSVVASSTTGVPAIVGMDDEETISSTETDGTHTVTFSRRLNLMVESYVYVLIDNTIIGTVSLNTPYLATSTFSHIKKPIIKDSTIKVQTMTNSAYNTDTLPITAVIKIIGYR